MLGSWWSSCPEVSERKLNHKDWKFNVKPALPVRKPKNTHQVEFGRLINKMAWFHQSCFHQSGHAATGGRPRFQLV